MNEPVNEPASGAAIDAVREGERVVEPMPASDAGIVFVGTIRTPFATRADCPRQGRPDGPLCALVLDERWAPAAAGLEVCESLEVLYWLDRSRRDLLVQRPRADGPLHGTFSLRSPNRPNPIGTSLVRLVRIEGGTLHVRGLDCIDGTPLVDVKPARCPYVPAAPEKAADRG